MRHSSARKLVDTGLVRAWLWSALLWLLTFGRLRPAHVNGMVFGGYSTAALGLLYYYVPMLCARPMVAAAVGWWAFYGWNAAVAAATLALLGGYNAGVALAEYAWPARLLLWLALAAVAVQVAVTVLRRREPQLYVSLYYVIMALVWMLLDLLIGGLVLPYFGVPGVTGAALQGFYAHGLFNLWAAPLG